MKRRRRICCSIFAVLFLCLSYTVQAAQNVTGGESIAGKTGIVKQETMSYSAAPGMYFPKQIKVHTAAVYLYSVNYMPANASIKNITVSNKKIVKVDEKNGRLQIRPQKAGTATLKFSVKYGQKSKKFSTKISVYKYANPVKAYTIGNLHLEKKYDKAASYQVKITKDMNVRLDVKAKSGWKINSITYYCNGRMTRYNTTSPVIRMKKTLGSSIQINFKNKKTGLLENIILWIRI